MDELTRRLNAETDARTNRKIELLPLSDRSISGIEALRKAWAALDPIPRVVHRREEGQDNSWPGIDLRTMIVGEETAGRFTFHNAIIAPGAGLPAHHLPDCDTYFYVLGGEIEIKVGNVTQTASKDTFAYVPEGITQAFANRSPEGTEMLVWHSPAGMERAFAAAHAHWLAHPDASNEEFAGILSLFGYHFHDVGHSQPGDHRTNQHSEALDFDVRTLDDFQELRAQWAQKAPIPKIVSDWRLAHDIFVPGQDTKRFLSGEESAGRAVVIQYGIEPGYVAPTHHQPTEEEIFLVVEGSLTLTAGNAETVLQPGGIGFVPRFGTHRFTNEMEQGWVRTVTINSPAGHDRAFVAAVKELTAEGGPTEQLDDVLVAYGWTFHDDPRGVGVH